MIIAGKRSSLNKETGVRQINDAVLIRGQSPSVLPGRFGSLAFRFSGRSRLIEARPPAVSSGAEPVERAPSTLRNGASAISHSAIRAPQFASLFPCSEKHYKNLCKKSLPRLRHTPYNEAAPPPPHAYMTNKTDPYATKLHARINVLLLVFTVVVIALLLRTSAHGQTTRIRGEWELDDWWAERAALFFPSYQLTLQPSALRSTNLSLNAGQALSAAPLGGVKVGGAGTVNSRAMGAAIDGIDTITATRTWANVGSTWSTGANWGGTAPIAGDTAAFNVAASVQPNLTTSASINNLLFSTTTASGYDITSSSTAITLTLTSTSSTGGASGTAAITGVMTGTNTIDAPIVLGAAGGSSQFFTNAGTLIFNGVISSTNSVTLVLGTAAGTYQFNGANTMTGTVQQNAGNTIVIGNKAAFGTATIQFNSATGKLQAGIDLTGANKITNNILCASTAETISNSGVNGIEFGGNVDLGGGVFTLNSAISGGATFDGVISNDAGAGLSFVTTNSSLVTLKGVNTYTGNTTISGTGKVSVSSIGNSGASGNLGQGTTINLGSGTGAAGTGTLVYTGSGETSTKVINLSGTTGGATIDQSSASGLLKFTANLTATGAGSKTLTLQGSTGGTGEISGAIVDNSGTNKTSVTKAGTGTWTLSGTNTYTGTTAVNGGNLFVNGSLASGSAVSVTNSGSVLGGTGTVNGPVTVNANAAILGGTGTTGPTQKLTLSGALTLADNSIVQLALGPSGAHSTLARTGAGSWTFDSNQAFSFIDLGAQATTYDNIITGLAADPGSEAAWIIQNPGFSGTFTYDGLGNIDLTLSAVPEPSTWAAGALALLAVGYTQRRRFQKKAAPMAADRGD